MARLVLVKHAPPQIAPEVASHRWVLSEDGRRRCEWLAAQLGALGVEALYSSLEPKALETAALVAVRLGLEVRPRAGLQENDRTGLGFGSIEDLHTRIRRFFAEPSDVTMGAESADAAAHRFENAVRALVAEAPGRTVAAVTHGTVLTTLAARYNPVVAFDFWASLELPCCVVLDAVSFRLDGSVRNPPP